MTPQSDATPDVTLAELLRRLNRIESKIDSSVFVSKDIFELVMKSMNDRLSKVEAAQTWAIRLMIGAFTGILVQAVVLALTLAKP